VKPIYLQAKGETGLETLISAGQLPEVSHLPEITYWPELLEILDQLRDEEHEFRTLVLDTLNGFERLCFEYVCETMYGGNWGKNGFSAYQQGYESSLSEWRLFLSKLDQLRTRSKPMAVIPLCHTKIINFKNPEGADFDRYQPDMHHKTWSLTHKWADMVLFFNYLTVVSEKQNERKKGKGGTDRFAYTQRSAAFDAKNRHGLPEQFSLGSDHLEAYQNFAKAMKGGEAE
tara:strand:+ start:3276 stop:3965 length:690 start_codon:yes stop_codon:yes gene_type:complete